MILVRCVAMFRITFLRVPDDDGKITSPSLPDSNSATTVGPGRQLQPAAIGPAEFLEMYRTRTVSDPRSDQRLDALSRVRMKKVSTFMSICLSAHVYRYIPYEYGDVFKKKFNICTLYKCLFRRGFICVVFPCLLISSYI